MEHTKLELEIHQLHLPLGEERLQNLIHRVPQLAQLPQDTRRRDIHQPQMVVVDQRVAQRVVLVIKLDNCRINPIPLFQSQPLRQTTCHRISHHDFDRYDSDSLGEHFSIIQPLHKVSADPSLLQELKEPLRNFIIDHPFFDDSAALLCIERRRVVLEILNDLV